MGEGPRAVWLLALVVFVTAGASCRSSNPAPGETAAPGALADCHTLPIERCADRSDCNVVQGQVVDLPGRCLRPAEPLACRPASQGCDDSLTFALGRDGRCIRLGDACLPAGFTPPPPGSACNQASAGEQRACAW